VPLVIVGTLRLAQSLDKRAMSGVSLSERKRCAAHLVPRASWVRAHAAGYAVMVVALAGLGWLMLQWLGANLRVRRAE
jgi:hypothetical protein